MQSTALAPGVFWVGVQDPGLRTFHVDIFAKNGSSYNAYLIKGSKKMY